MRGISETKSSETAGISRESSKREDREHRNDEDQLLDGELVMHSALKRQYGLIM
jgi:hypothetical protein